MKMLSRFVAAIVITAIANTAIADNQVGTTYPIKERSALEEINTEVNAFEGVGDVDVLKTTAFKGFPLPANQQERVRVVTPFYTLDFDISDDEGNIIYPKGFTYNPAEYIKLPFRIFVFGPNHADIVKEHRKPNDVLLLTEGDIFEVQRELEAQVFYLEGRMAERLLVKGVPTIVEQIGAQYQHSEIATKKEHE
jgi:hypothetical protein